MTTAAVALGSNLGDRRAHLEEAVTSLRGLLLDLRVSAFIETDPVGVAPQPRYLNGAVAGETDLPAPFLFERLLDIERAHGRERPFPGSPRTLDLDLVLYGPLVLDSASLTVPHPRFRERGFVLEPLASIAPGLVDPVTGLTIGELLRRLGRSKSR